MTATTHRVAIVGCGRQGQRYAAAYRAFPEAQIVAIVDPNAQRRKVVAGRFDVERHYETVPAMLGRIVPDVVAVVTPVKYTKAAVIACAEAGVKGLSAEKPLGGVLADADEMISVCAQRHVVFSGGALQRAMPEVQEAAARIHRGELGRMTGAAVHGFGGEIVGGGCQHISVLRLLMDAEVDRVVARGTPAEALASESDRGLDIHGRLVLSNGVACDLVGTGGPWSGVEVWNDEWLVRWAWGPPQIFHGRDAAGDRAPIDPGYAPYAFPEFDYLGSSIRSLLRAIETGSSPWITGHDLRQALEVAIAAKQSALRNEAEVKLPLEDRRLALYPSPYRWLGGDESGAAQTMEEAAGEEA